MSLMFDSQYVRTGGNYSSRTVNIGGRGVFYVRPSARQSVSFSSSLPNLLSCHPIISDTDLDSQRHVQYRCGFHLAFDYLRRLFDLVVGGLE